MKPATPVISHARGSARSCCWRFWYWVMRLAARKKQWNGRLCRGSLSIDREGGAWIWRRSGRSREDVRILVRDAGEIEAAGLFPARALHRGKHRFILNEPPEPLRKCFEITE